MPNLLNRINQRIFPVDTMGGLLQPADARDVQRQSQLMLGAGLLSSAGPSTMPISFGQAIGNALPQAQIFRNERQREALRNEVARGEIVRHRRQLDAEEQLQSLLDQSGDPTLGLLGRINPQAAAEGLLAQAFAGPGSLESPIGKMLSDLRRIEASGNTDAINTMKQAIAAELGGEIDLGNVLSVRDDVTRNSSEYLQAQAGFEKVRSAANSATPAGDMALIFGYMKILDPGSIVREGEFATVQNSASVPEQIRGLYNRVLRGERLTPEQRQDFLAQSHAQFMPMVEQQQRLIRDAQSFASRNNLRFEDIVPEFVMPTLPAPIAPPTERSIPSTAGGLFNDIRRDFGNLFRPQSIAPVVEASRTGAEALQRNAAELATAGRARAEALGAAGRVRAADIARMSAQQLEALQQRAADLSDEALAAATKRWAELNAAAE